MISSEISDGVMTLTLARPPVNALNSEMWEALEYYVSKAEADRTVRALVIATDNERVFSAGADIKEFGEFLTFEAGFRMAQRIHSLQNRLERLPQVTVAAIEGVALGGGCELALACDLRLASDEARLGFPEVTVGQFPGTGGTLRLAWLIGEGWARELLLSGRAVEAATALAMGLVNRVVPTGRARTDAVAWARELTARPPAALAAVKRSLILNRDHDVAKGSERDAVLSGWIFETDDALEGHRAFVDRRSPCYTHRLPATPLPEFNETTPPAERGSPV